MLLNLIKTKTRHISHGQNNIRFNLTELSGAFGDRGTFIPLVAALIIINRVSASSVLTTFGISYIFSGLVFGAPIPIQPMKAIATLAIVGGVSSEIIVGGRIAIGAFFFPSRSYSRS
ncbi:MAG: putative sulfate/molybdate transporter [Candidatus Bathyarchaeota archaeon]